MIRPEHTPPWTTARRAVTASDNDAGVGHRPPSRKRRTTTSHTGHAVTSQTISVQAVGRRDASFALHTPLSIPGPRPGCKDFTVNGPLATDRAGCGYHGPGQPPGYHLGPTLPQPEPDTPPTRLPRATKHRCSREPSRSAPLIGGVTDSKPLPSGRPLDPRRSPYDATSSHGSGTHGPIIKVEAEKNINPTQRSIDKNPYTPQSFGRA